MPRAIARRGAGKGRLSESQAQPGPITADVQRDERDVAQRMLCESSGVAAELKADSKQKAVASAESLALL